MHGRGVPGGPDGHCRHLPQVPPKRAKHNPPCWVLSFLLLLLLLSLLLLSSLLLFLLGFCSWASHCPPPPPKGPEEAWGGGLTMSAHCEVNDML